MSSALVRQALAFVDPEETKAKGKKRRAESSRPEDIGQVTRHQYKKKNKTQTKVGVLPQEDRTEENIKKLLALSTPSANKAVAEKIVQRAIAGKPLLDKIEVKVVKEKSILFPEDEENNKKPKTKKRYYKK